MSKTLFVTTMVLVLFMSCQSRQNIEGLWIVKSVSIGDEEMTPNARWMKFNSDFTQQSGNGWFQHSTGTWTYDPANQSLEINNSNGLVDTFEPFKVTLLGEQMIWNRSEDGQPVQVDLARAEKLPTTYGDQVLGLWKLETAEGEGRFFSDSVSTNDYLFLMWDKKFVVGTIKGKAYGVYNTHGHKPELELIPYGDRVDRSFWSIEYGDGTISLNLLNSDSVVTRSFRRIDDFPQ